MEAIEILRNEHTLIHEFLNQLAWAVLRMERGETPPRRFFEKAVDFAQTYADRYHHFKEEYVMFTLLAQKKEGAMDVHIETLRHQHERGRDNLAAILEALDGYERGSGIAASNVIENAAAYVSRLRQHIHREDSVFFSLAAACFSEDEHQRLLEEFKKAEEKHGGVEEKSRRLVEEMKELLEKEPASAPNSRPPGEGDFQSRKGVLW